MNMTDKERGQHIQFLILPSTIAVVDKGTSLHCYYVKMCRTGEYACDTCSTYFYIIAVKGCSFVYLRNCIFCPLSLSVMFIVEGDEMRKDESIPPVLQSQTSPSRSQSCSAFFSRIRRTWWLERKKGRTRFIKHSLLNREKTSCF